MSFKQKVLAAAATLTLLGGVSAAGALTAGTATAATPSCGHSCVNIFTKQFGTFHSPNYTVDVLKQNEKAGASIILFRTANYDPALDWTVAFQGLVSDFYNAKMVSAAVNLHYGCDYNDNTNTCASSVFPDDPAFEVEYAPYGVNSGLCMGVASTAVTGEGVTLQPCGTSANTVWIVDTYDSWGLFTNGGFFPLINGSDTNFSEPYVLTYPASGFPTDNPRPQLTVTQLTGAAAGNGGPEIGTIQSNQLWSAKFGVLS